MKVRALPVPATDEDVTVWEMVCMRAFLRARTIRFATALVCVDPDRRDAELMFWAQRWRTIEWRKLEFSETPWGWAGVLWYRGELPFGGSHYNLYRPASKE